MELIRNVLGVVFIFIMLISCGNMVGENRLKEYREPLYNVSIENFTNHFIEDLNGKDFRYISCNPSTNDDVERNKQFGYSVLIASELDFDWSEIQVEPDEIQFESKYSNCNFVIFLPEINQEKSSCENCNIASQNSLPVPYFQYFDFGLGVKEKTEIKDNRYRSEFIIPQDLYVYVIKAESGNFFEKSIEANRASSLETWKRGYSRGIAISKQNELVVFWAIIW